MTSVYLFLNKKPIAFGFFKTKDIKKTYIKKKKKTRPTSSPRKTISKRPKLSDSSTSPARPEQEAVAKKLEETQLVGFLWIVLFGRFYGKKLKRQSFWGIFGGCSLGMLDMFHVFLHRDVIFP